MPLPGWHSLRELLAFILRSTKRIVVLAIGVALLLGGIALLVLPGPGLLVIIAGLAVLASEFAWAERMLDLAKDKAGQAKDRAQQTWRGRRGARPPG